MIKHLIRMIFFTLFICIAFNAYALADVKVLVIPKGAKAFFWTIPLILCSYFGFIHSTSIGIGMAGYIPLGYALFALIIILVYFYNRFTDKGEDSPVI